jgi:hypothetical protein
MSNKRWGSDDKIELMKLYSAGKSYKDIGNTLKRSSNAIKLRLESIVYENLVKGKPISILTRMLNTNQENIKQLYYSHKSFRQSRNELVEDVLFPPTNNIPNTQSHHIKQEQYIDTQNTNMHHPNMHHHDNGQSGGSQFKSANRHSIIKTQFDHKNNRNNFTANIESLETENKVLDELIKNYQMKRQLRKLYVEGKLDEKSIDLYEKMLRKSKKLNIIR